MTSVAPACRAVVVLGFALIWSTALETAQRGAPSARTPIQIGEELFGRLWTVKQGLGPRINGRSCAGCHAAPRIGGSGKDARSLVSVVASSEPYVFQRFRLTNLGAFDEELPPPSAALRKTPSLLGSALLESISDKEISESLSESRSVGRVPLGRFGWKGHLRDIEEATTAAFINELGLIHPEISQNQLKATAAFVRSLPPPQSSTIAGANEGRALFNRLGCVTCHRPSFPSLERLRAFPYTDLLLHDMGPSLEDGVRQGSASPREFKTPPLWGIGEAGPPYLHDGRAKTLHEAITGHGGEAETSAETYKRLDSAERAALLAFVQSL
jgi:CxxC motif-containing protein (DUF1111 family)